MGMAMAQGLVGPWGAAPAQSARPSAQPAAHPAANPAQPAAMPPPPPVEHVWHIAENGETRGPFGRADLGRMAQAGELDREALVWTPGQDGWKPAGEIRELAQLFTVLPPPPPPPAG